MTFESESFLGIRKAMRAAGYGIVTCRAVQVELGKVELYKKVGYIRVDVFDDKSFRIQTSSQRNMPKAKMVSRCCGVEPKVSSREFTCPRCGKPCDVKNK